MAGLTISKVDRHPLQTFDRTTEQHREDNPNHRPILARPEIINDLEPEWVFAEYGLETSLGLDVDFGATNARCPIYMDSNGPWSRCSRLRAQARISFQAEEYAITTKTTSGAPGVDVMRFRRFDTVRNSARLTRVSHRLTALLVPASIGLTGCGANPGDTEPEAIEQAESPFTILTPAALDRVRRLPAGNTFAVCLYGSALTALNRADRQNTIRDAIMTWVDGARAATTLSLINRNDIAFVAPGPNNSRCSGSYDVDVNWAAGPGRAVANPMPGGSWGWMVLYENDGLDVALHEFGHIFGIGDTYVEGVWTCYPGQENSVMCGVGGPFITLQRDDLNAMQEIICMAYPGSCTHRWQADMHWCAGAPVQLLTGDFSGEGRADMLCHDKSTGYKWIAYADPNGRFSGTGWQLDMKWCYGPNQQLLLGDFNGDKRADMLCHNTATGYKWIAYAGIPGRFSTTGWQLDMKWCYGANAQLLLGDFNGDKRTDMLCHDTATGYKWIAYANINGKFSTTGWESNMMWCFGANAQLLLGDFNGDKRADMLCHDTATDTSGSPMPAFLGGSRRRVGSPT